MELYVEYRSVATVVVEGSWSLKEQFVELVPGSTLLLIKSTCLLLAKVCEGADVLFALNSAVTGSIMSSFKSFTPAHFAIV